MNEKYLELENKHYLITKILKEEVDVGFIEKLIAGVR